MGRIMVYDDIAYMPVTHAEMVRLNDMLIRQTMNAYVYQGPLHEGDLLTAIDVNGSAEFDDPRGE